MIRSAKCLAASLACLFILASCGKEEFSTPSLGNAEQACLEAISRQTAAKELTLLRTIRTVQSTSIYIGVPGVASPFLCVTTPAGQVQTVTPAGKAAS